MKVSEKTIKIICYAEELKYFLDSCHKKFWSRTQSLSELRPIGATMTSIYRFKYDDFTIQITAQETPIERQKAFQVFLTEKKFFNFCNPKFRTEIEYIRETGLRLDWAFGQIFNLGEDPRRKLAEIYSMNEKEFRTFVMLRRPDFVPHALDLLKVPDKKSEQDAEESDQKIPIDIYGWLSKKNNQLSVTPSGFSDQTMVKPEALLRVLLVVETKVTELLVKVASSSKAGAIRVRTRDSLDDGKYPIVAIWPRQLRRRGHG